MSIIQLWTERRQLEAQIKQAMTLWWVRKNRPCTACGAEAKVVVLHTGPASMHIHRKDCPRMGR